jgi:hypothetical protein
MKWNEILTLKGYCSNDPVLTKGYWYLIPTKLGLACVCKLATTVLNLDTQSYVTCVVVGLASEAVTTMWRVVGLASEADSTCTCAANAHKIKLTFCFVLLRRSLSAVCFVEVYLQCTMRVTNTPAFSQWLMANSTTSVFPKRGVALITTVLVQPRVWVLALAWHVRRQEITFPLNHWCKSIVSIPCLTTFICYFTYKTILRKRGWRSVSGRKEHGNL